jgi:cobalt-zinc-cadmium efflux system outer membrane protein
MTMLKYLIKISVTFLLLSNALAAQTISLSQVLSFVLLGNPELAAFSYDMRASDAKILQAGLYPNPALDVETENLGVEDIQTTILLSQLIELGGKQRARILQAHAERSKYQLEYEVKKRQLFIETADLFIEILMNQQKASFLQDSISMLESLSASVRRRVEAGKASAIEQNNFKALLALAYVDLKKAKNELVQAKNKLAAKWGATKSFDFTVAGNLDWTLPVISLEELGCFLYNHPQIQLLGGEEDLRAARLRVEKSKSMTDVTVRGGPRFLFDRNEWAWVVGVFMPLPINDRNQGNILAAYENWRRIEQERQAIWTTLLAELNQAYALIFSLNEEIQVLIEIVLPATQDALTASYEGYQNARYSYLEILESERSFRSARIRYFEALEQYHKALAKLEGLTGTQAIFRCN